MVPRWVRVALLVFLAAAVYGQTVSEIPIRLPTGPPPFAGGRVHSIAVHPRDAAQIIVVKQFGGLWKTVDGGATWSHLDGLPAVFAVDARWTPDGSTIVATLERDTRADNGGGIYRSTDGGTIWTRTGAVPAHDRIAPRRSAYGISIPSDEPRRVYVGTDYGVAISDDAGATWEHRRLDDVSPPDREGRQSSVFSILALPEGKVLATTRRGLWRSDDRGARWRLVRSGDFAFQNSAKLMDAFPGQPDYVVIQQTFAQVWLYQLSADTLDSLRIGPSVSRGPFVRISRAPGGRYWVWVGQGLHLRRRTVSAPEEFRREAGWPEIVSGLHADAGDLAVDSEFRPILYGNDGGLFRPVDPQAVSWEPVYMNTLQITDVHAVTIPAGADGSERTSLFFGTQDNHLWGSPDGGRTWPRSDCTEGFGFDGPAEALAENAATIAYVRISCTPPARFSDAAFGVRRDVPDVDAAGNLLSQYDAQQNPIVQMAGPVYAGPNQWIRYRKFRWGLPEIWVSDNDGAHWRRRARLSFEERGAFKVARALEGRVAFTSVRFPSPGVDDHRIALLRLPLFAPDERLGESSVIALPDGGSLAQRATAFDWHTVFGVDPRDARFIIAPDARNNVIKVTRTGGTSWSTDRQLTDLVTDRGTLLLSAGDGYFTQVTQIEFDPFNRDRIVVGTRDRGVIVSNDRGRSWQHVAGSERISYVSGIAFRYDRGIYVSSYGRGLWKIDFPRSTEALGQLRDFLLCRKLECIIRPIPDPRTLRKIDWASNPILLVRHGRITGWETDSRGAVTRVSVTPGATLLRSATAPEVAVAESAKGKPGKITALVLQDGMLAYAVETPRTLTADDVAEAVVAAEPDAQPYLMVTTTKGLSGRPVAAPGGTLYLHGYDFAPGPVVVEIDGQPVKGEVTVNSKGILQGSVQVPANLSAGLHEVAAGGAKSSFAVSYAEDDGKQ